MPPDLTFGWISLSQALAEGVEDLLTANWEEAASGKDRYPLDPDWQQYMMLERSGMYVAVAARKDASLVGYAGYFLHTPLHHRTKRWATNDMVYLAPEYRLGPAGRQLIDASVGLLRGRGVDRVCHTVKVGSPRRKGRDRLGAVFLRSGFEHDEDLYVLDL